MLAVNRALRYAAVLVLAVALPAAAQEDAAEIPPQAVPEDSVPAADIAVLVKQLDSDRFADRQAASQELEKIGRAAIPALAEAAGGDSLEVTVRSIDILRKLGESEDETLQKESKTALKKIAESDCPSAARRAQDALKALEPPPAAPHQIMPGAIQLNVAGGARRVSVKNINGVKEIDAEEGDRKVKVVDDPKSGIKMEVTTKKNGKEVTEKYEAKNEEELKKKHPEAYKIYKKYDQAGGGMMFQMQIAGGPIRIGRAQIAQAKRPNKLETAGRMIAAWGSSLKRLADDNAIQEASETSRKDLSQKVAELKTQLDDLEKRLEKASQEKEELKKAGEESEPAADE